MRRLILLLGLLGLLACLSACTKPEEEVDLSVAGTTWSCKYMGVEYTMTFGTSTVTVSQFDYEHNKKYWDDASGTYTQNGREISFDLFMPVIVSQQRYLHATTGVFLMTVTIQDYLNGQPFAQQYTLTYQIKR